MRQKHGNAEDLGSNDDVISTATDQMPGKKNILNQFWLFIILTLALLIFLIIFIAQNDHKIKINYLGFHWDAALGIALSSAAVIGGFIVALAIGWRLAYKRRQKQALPSHDDN